jgi:hypothetical protein
MPDGGNLPFATIGWSATFQQFSFGCSLHASGQVATRQIPRMADGIEASSPHSNTGNDLLDCNPCTFAWTK